MSQQQQQNGAMDMSGVADALPGLSAGLTAEDRANVVAALKDKLRSLVRLNSDVLETLSPKVRKRVEYLVYIQKQHDELEAKFFEERAALEDRYQKLYEPLYAKRYEIVTGAAEVEGGSDETSDGVADGNKSGEEEEKGVPEFWLSALKTNDVTGGEIQERDEAALKYLKDIKWSRTTEPKGFKLDFFFDPNPFFKNSVLTKTYEMIEDDEPILEKATGTEIEWYPGKCLTQKVMRKKPKKGGGAKDSKSVTKVKDCASFFNFFSPPPVPQDVDDLDEEQAEELQNEMEQDYDVGSTIRDKIIPHAVSWFTGEAVSDDDLFEDEDDDDDDEELESEEEDEQEVDGVEEESKEKPSA